MKILQSKAILYFALASGMELWLFFSVAFFAIAQEKLIQSSVQVKELQAEVLTLKDQLKASGKDPQKPQFNKEGLHFRIEQQGSDLVLITSKNGEETNRQQVNIKGLSSLPLKKVTELELLFSRDNSGFILFDVRPALRQAYPKLQIQAIQKK